MINDGNIHLDFKSETVQTSVRAQTILHLCTQHRKMQATGEH